MVNLALSELRKLLTLPSFAVAALVNVAATAAIAALNGHAVAAALASGETSSFSPDYLTDAGFMELSLGAVGAIVVGVACAASEYRTRRDETDDGRPVTATLLACPQRLRLIVAKLIALTVAVVALAVAGVPATLAASRWALGPSASTGMPWGPAAGVTLYWVLTAMIAFAVALVARNGLWPLAVLIANSSVVSVSYLLAKLTPAAVYLPDLAGARLYLHPIPDLPALHPITAAAMMTGWAVLFTAGAAAVFARRDV